MEQGASRAGDAQSLEQELASLVEGTIRSPQTFDSVLATLEDRERMYRLTADTTNAPICARAIIKLYLTHKRASDAIQALSVLMKRRAQSTEATQACVDELVSYLHSRYQGESQRVARELIPLLEPLIKHIAGLIIVESVYISLSIWCMLCYRRVGETEKAVRIAEALNADTAGSLAYADRMDFATQQLEVALWAGEYVKCLILGARVREKTLREVYDGHHAKWLEAIHAADTDNDETLYFHVEQLRGIRRRYYSVMAEAHFRDRNWASYSRCAWEQAQTYLEEVRDVLARGDEVTPEEWSPQIFDLSTLISSAAVAAFLAPRDESSSAVLAGLAQSTLFAENASYVRRHLRPLCAAIHPLSKVLVHSFVTSSGAFDSDWDAVQAKYGPDSADPCSCTRYSRADGEEKGPILGCLRMFTEPGTDVDRAWKALARAYLMHYLRICVTMYSRIPLADLAKLIKCSEEELEEALVSLEDVYLKIDRPAGVVSFQEPETVQARAEKWQGRIRVAIRRVMECSYLVGGGV